MTEGKGERTKETPDITMHDPNDLIGGVAGRGSGERATGTPNAVYNLSSVLFHALQGGASHDTYIEDAEQEEDEELTEFFRRVREEDRDRAAEARMLLAERTLTDVRAEGTAPSVPVTEDLPLIVTTTEGAEPDVPPRTGPSGGLPGTEPRAEGASSGASGDARREYAVTERPGEDLTPPGEGGVPPTSTEGAAPPRPEPSHDFPGTEPVREDDSKERVGEVPPPEEVPPERAREIPMAEEVPPPRTEEIPTYTQTHVSPGDVTSPWPGDIPHEDMVPPTPPPPRGTGESPMAEEERVGQEEGEEDRSLIDRLKDRVRDGLTGDEEQRGEGTGRPDRR
jgi:hypothetical protein